MSEMVAEVKIEDISTVKKKLFLEIPWTEVKTELDEAYRTVGQKAKIKGFRAGKAPRKILEQFYKKEAEEEAISNLVSKSYTNALEIHNIMAVSQPVIDQKGIEIDKKFAYSATVEVHPLFEPQDYSGMEVEKEEYEITDDDVEARIEQIRQMYSTIESIEEDRDVINGDYVVIDFEGKVDETIRKELTSENYLLEIGSNMFIPGFEEKLIGTKKGETKELRVDFPEDYTAKDFAGKEGLFSVTLKDIRVKNVPELDENFIKNFEAYESIDELKKDIHKSLTDENEARIKSDLRKNLVTKLLEKNEFEVPSTFVNRQIYYMMIDVQQRMINNGMDPQKAAQISSNLHDKFESDATRMVKTSLLLAKIAEKESIIVDEKDIEERLHELTTKYSQDYDSLKGAYESNNLIDRLKDEILEEKTLNFLEEKADLKTVTKKSKKVTGEE
ncbi:MAG: trigger factor [Deltaproteobacteria bacterium]|nr:trigger factor [Deltaproteobacteria bacterium]